MTKTLEQQERWYVEYFDGIDWAPCISSLARDYSIASELLNSHLLNTLEKAIEYRDLWPKRMLRTSLANAPLRIIHEYKEITVETQVVNFVRENYEAAMEMRNEADKIIAKLREECTHTNFTKQAEGSSGNFDPSNDYFRYLLTCRDCGKQKYIDQVDFPLSVRGVWPK